MYIPNRHWVVDILSNFLHWTLLPAIMVFIVLTAMRKWRNAAYWSIPTLAWLILFGSLFLPGFESRHHCSPGGSLSCVHLRVMTFNAFSSNVSDYQLQIDMLRNADADIIALQEVSLECIETYKSRLSDLYPFLIHFPEGLTGKGFLSKYPISGEESIDLNAQSLYHKQVIINVDGLEIIIINVHPPAPFTLQHISRGRKEIRSLVEITQDVGQVILLGDFNITDQASVYRLLSTSGLRDTYREVGWGFGSTWPTRFRSHERVMPVVRIDYIWHSDDFQAVAAWTGPRTFSDHLPVIADLIYEL